MRGGRQSYADRAGGLRAKLDARRAQQDEQRKEQDRKSQERDRRRETAHTVRDIAQTLGNASLHTITPDGELRPVSYSAKVDVHKEVCRIHAETSAHLATRGTITLGNFTTRLLFPNHKHAEEEYEGVHRVSTSHMKLPTSMSEIDALDPSDVVYVDEPFLLSQNMGDTFAATEFANTRYDVSYALTQYQILMGLPLLDNGFIEAWCNTGDETPCSVSLRIERYNKTFTTNFTMKQLMKRVSDDLKINKMLMSGSGAAIKINTGKLDNPDCYLLDEETREFGFEMKRLVRPGVSDCLIPVQLVQFIGAANIFD